MNLIIIYLSNILIRMAGVIPGEKATGIRGRSLFPTFSPRQPVKRLWLHKLLLKHILIPQTEQEQALRSRTRRAYRLGTESVPFFFYVVCVRPAHLCRRVAGAASYFVYCTACILMLLSIGSIDFRVKSAIIF